MYLFPSKEDSPGLVSGFAADLFHPPTIVNVSVVLLTEVLNESLLCGLKVSVFNSEHIGEGLCVVQCSDHSVASSLNHLTALGNCSQIITSGFDVTLELK